MAGEIAMQVATMIRRIDSLSANEFAVELEGQRQDAIFRVSGLIPFKLDVKATTSLKVLREPIKVVKMVRRDPADGFNRWMQETTAAKDDIVRPKRTLAVVALDGGQETRRWTFHGAWISEVTYSDFDSGSSDLVQETLTVQWEEMEITWPAG